MGFGTSAVKFLLILFNFLFVIAGILLIALGVLCSIGFDKYLELIVSESGQPLDISYKTPAILLILIGSLIFTISFTGCCGAAKENFCLLITFATVLTLILLSEIVLGVTATIFKGDFETLLKTGFEKSMKKYGPENEALTSSWNTMQHNLKCCGVESYADWKTSTWTNSPTHVVPSSCCITQAEGCSTDMVNKPADIAEKTIFIEGCLTKALNPAGIFWMIAVTSFVGIVELLGIIFACYLASSSKNGRYESLH